jgi:hypothetical protein
MIMNEDFGKIIIECNKCNNKSEIDYKQLNNVFTSMLFEGNLKKGNINKLLPKFCCSKCNSRSLKILDKDSILLFDTDYSRKCNICNIHIPLNIPDYNTCIDCRLNNEIESSKGFEFPPVPSKYRGECSRCKKNEKKGMIVVYQNSSNKDFFLGCSSFPSCRWSKSLDQKEFDT